MGWILTVLAVLAVPVLAAVGWVCWVAREFLRAWFTDGSGFDAEER